MRCPRCSNELSDDASSCDRCGLTVATTPSNAGGSSSAGPSAGAGSAGGAASPAGPPSGVAGAPNPTGPAPWQSAPTDAGDAASGRSAAAADQTGPRPGWFPGQQQEPAEPELVRPVDQYSRPFAGMVLVTLVVAACVALTYGLLAAIERRGIFAALADDRSAVTHDEASRSDTINAVVFFAGVVTTALALVLVCVWLFHVRGLVARIPLTLPWGLAALAGLGGVAAALVLHQSEDAERIVTGYLVFAAGAVLLTAACVIGIVAVRRVGRDIAAAKAQADEPPAPWVAPRA